MAAASKVPPREEKPPQVKRLSSGYIDWTKELQEILREDARLGRSASQTALWLGVSKASVLSMAHKAGADYNSPAHERFGSLETIQELSFIDPVRVSAGVEPLPPGHPLTWGLICPDPFPREVRFNRLHERV